MITHRQSEEIITWGAGALGNLAIDGKEPFTCFLLFLFLLFLFILLFFFYSFFFFFCLLVLLYLISDSNKLQLKQKGAIGLLITSMRLHLANEYLQEFACGALEAFAHLRTFSPLLSN